MLETSSSPAAEAMTPFASPMLASIERLVSRLARRIAGPQSQFTGRSLQFADRIFSRRLDTLGMGAAAAPETLFAERSMEPQSWLLPKTWVPSAAALRAGPMSVLPPVAESPASKRVAANTPLVAPAAVKQPDGAVKPPVVTPTAVVAPVVPGRSGFEQPMPQVSPAWSAEQPVPTVEAAKSAASAGTSGVTAAPETPAPKTAERLVGEVAASGPAVPLPAAEAAARPASAEAIVGASPQAAPAPELAESSASAAVASLTPTSAVNTVAASTIAAESRPVAAEPVATSSPGAAPVPQLTEAGSVAGSPSVTANAGSRPASAVAPSAAAVAVAVAQARAEQIVADERPRPASDTEPGLPAPTLVESAGRPLLSRAAPSAGIPIGAPSGSSGSPLETRVRDLLPPMLQRAAAASAPALGPLSAFSRSLGHLGWSDDRLGRTTSAERGKLPSLNFDGLAEPGSSSRAAAAPVLPMVQAADLTPRSATRPIGQLGQPVVAAPSAPSRAVAPLRQPGAAVPQPMVVLSQSDEQPSTLPRQAAISAAAPSAALGATAVAAPISAPISAPTSAESAVFGSASAAANSPAPMATTPAAAAISGASAETASALPGTESSAALPSAERTLARSVAQPARAPAQIGLSAPAGLSVGTRSLSPSLLASPALTAHGPASLVELFLSGQSARAGMSALGTLPALATTQPFRTPGALASHTERMATAIGTHVTAGSAGVGNPFGGGQRWSVAPGLTRMVSRALGRAESVAPGLWTKLSSELPYLEEPGNGPRAAQSAATATTPAAQPGAGIARLSPLLTMAAPGLAVSPMDATVAPMAHVRRPEFVPEALIGPPAAGPMSELRASGGVLGSATSTPSAPSAARPWQLAGGMATLAELFAAGVGMGTGAAGDIARQAGVAPAVGLMPPWLTKAAARSTFGLAASELASERSGRSLGSALEFVSDDGETPAVKSADPMARALSRSAALPPVSAPGQLAASAPQLVAAQSNSTAQSSPAATAAEAQSGAASRMPFWQHAGGLAATAEAFAGGHGIGRVAQQASGAPASAGHWVPVTGGMVFVSDEPQRAASPAAAAVAQPRPMLPSLALAAPAAGQTAAATPEAAASRAALPLAALPQVRPAAAESEVTAATPGRWRWVAGSTGDVPVALACAPSCLPPGWAAPAWARSR